MYTILYFFFGFFVALWTRADGESIGMSFVVLLLFTILGVLIQNSDESGWKR